MLRRRLNENSLFENQEAKSIDAAKRFLIDNNLIRPQNVDWYIRIEVRDKIPSLKTKLGGKFILGCTRITFPMDAEEDDDFMSNMSYIDRIIRRIVDAHYDEYDRDFNGLGFDELVNEFNDELKEELENEKRVIKSLHLKKCMRYLERRKILQQEMLTRTSLRLQLISRMPTTLLFLMRADRCQRSEMLLSPGAMRR